MLNLLEDGFMSKSLLPTPDDLTLDKIQERFNTDETAREYLESIRWPDGPVCPHCQNSNSAKIWSIVPNKDKNIRAGLRQCGECKKQFTVTVGTIFEDSHIPLRKWLVAWYLINSSKKGISALQIQRMLALGSYRTAHFMMHRIRYVLRDTIFGNKLGGTVEVDETYIGGKPRPVMAGKRIFNKYSEKIRVVSLVERKGRKRSVTSHISGKTLRAIVKEHVADNSVVVTDDHKGYRPLRRDPKLHHHSINHTQKEYARRLSEKFTVHTNTVESSFSLLKRGVVGTFHHVSKQHLGLYIAEFDHRWNTKDGTDGARTVEGLKKMEGKRLTYHEPKSSNCGKVREHEGQSPADCTQHLV